MLRSTSFRALLASASAALVVVGALPATARACPTFPGDIEMDLSLSYSPPCNVCHATVAGGGPVTQSFGIAMVGFGLSACSDASVKDALDAMTAAGTDSDCSGVSDVQQLENGQDPNTGASIDGKGSASAGDGGTCNETALVQPSYGCGAQLTAAPASAFGAGALSAALALLASGARRRRRTDTRASRSPL